MSIRESSLGRRERLWNVLRILLGVFLIAAAVLKLTGKPVSAMPQVGWLATPMVQVAVAEWEIILGLWLLSGAAPAGAWLASILTFSTFAMVSGYFGWIGIARCGCFGSLPVSPWHAFGIDVVVLAALLAARGRRTAMSADEMVRHRREMLRTWGFGIAAILLLLVLIWLGAQMYGSTSLALARLRGEPLSVTPMIVDFGKGRGGTELVQSTMIRNWTSDPVHIVGGTSDCSCITTDTLPLVIQPGGSASLPLRLRLPAGATGVFTRSADLWTDCESQRRVRVRLTCVVQ